MGRTHDFTFFIIGGGVIIPQFNDEGNLPKGEHKGSWKEIVQRYGYSMHRRRLLDGLRQALQSLKSAGCRCVYINGSFVTSKKHPEDFDGCWDPINVDPSLLDPTLLDFTNHRAAQKARFGGELFPSTAVENGKKTPFMRFFQTDKRTGAPKGIVVIDLRYDL